MSDIAIRIENLGKLYRIGAREQYKALRDRITDALNSPFRRARSLILRHKDNLRRESTMFWALKDVSLEIRQGDVVGLIGNNGAGKSTLLKILSRITDPTEGRVEIHGRVASLLEVGTGFHPELTGRENIYMNGALLGMKNAEISRKFDEIVAFSELEKFIDTPVKHYSSGMYVRLAFSVPAHMQPEILLVDEVLAVGDAAFQRKCLGKMDEVAKQGRTVLFVSHNMGAVSNLCRRGIILSQGCVSFNGDVQDAIECYNRGVLDSDFANPEAGMAHILYRNNSPFDRLNDPACAVTRIETLDEQGQPKPVVGTFDNVVFRISYESRRHIVEGSVVFQIRSLTGSQLILLSTRPDASLSLSIEPGVHQIECRIEKLPLASGEYVVGAGLAVPNIEWLWLNPELGKLTVVDRDVYGSGFAPRSNRCLLAVAHQWRTLET